MKIVDMRSDTVTKPTEKMRAAMAAAEVGDDVYGEDPTVNRLQELAAAMLGKEAGLFVPSGTMGNAIAIRILTERGDEVLVERRSHVVKYELSGMSVLSGVMPRTVDAPGGHLTPEHVRAAVAPKAYYKSDVSLVVLENTHNLGGGTVEPRYPARRLLQGIASVAAAGPDLPIEPHQHVYRDHHAKCHRKGRPDEYPDKCHRLEGAHHGARDPARSVTEPVNVLREPSQEEVAGH